MAGADQRRFLWGGILMCHAASRNFAGLMTARFFLGVGEAAIAPGFSLITGMFYQREEQPIRQAAWYFGNCLAALLGGLVGYGIGHINAPGVTRWELLFLILGAITSGYGLVLAAFLPDSPSKAIFLKKRQRAIAVQRTLKNKTGVLDSGSFRWDQVRQALIDPQTWFLVLYTFCVNLCNGGLTSFMSIIIAGFGFSTFKALLLQMPFGGIEIIFLVFTSFVASYVRSSRITMMAFSTAAAMVGMLLVWKLDPENKAGRIVGISLGAAYATNIPLSLGLITSNVAGFTKRSVTSALIMVAYCVGNIVGPQFFLSNEAPSYPTGMKAAISGLVLGIFFLGCLYVYYEWENRRRDRVHGGVTEIEELRDELSNKTDLEIESFRYVK
ncbi:Allantoate [Aspergillus sclerotialis]|uniref:Allantoate n=1 Tax=Aspergillus sclerotialis TaxID=2070753 RepID=A0A3A3ADZ6_9EURO|nr:Allantoate [Aspergillus sclerotialis]